MKMEAMIIQDGKGSSMDLQTKSQLISHQCFRTIKEASEVLATCVERIPLPCKAKSNVDTLSLEWIAESGAILCKLMGSVSSSILI